MAREAKAKQMEKQKRKEEGLSDEYENRALFEDPPPRRAWASVNKQTSAAKKRSKTLKVAASRSKAPAKKTSAKSKARATTKKAGRSR